VDVDQRREARVGGGELFDREAVLDEARARSAVFLGNEHAEESRARPTVFSSSRGHALVLSRSAAVGATTSAATFGRSRGS
jgi:hypothetical protein